MPHSPAADDLSFDRATQLRARPGQLIFDLDIHPGWTVGDKPNGGILLALLARAASEALGGAGGGPAPDAISATVTYLAAPALSAAEVRTTVLRRGRTASHVRAVLVQADRDLVDAVFVMGTPSPGAAPRYSDLVPLDIPRPEECVRLPSLLPDGLVVSILDTTDLRLDPATIASMGAATGVQPPRAEVRGWVRFADGREPDARSLLYFVDAIPPATQVLGSTGWVPTLSMTVYVRARPAAGWLGVRFTAHLVEAGLVDEVCTLWDSRAWWWRRPPSWPGCASAARPGDRPGPSWS